METKDTCLYIHTRKSDGGIFYVGIGDEDRPYKKQGRNSHWYNVVNKYDYDITILKTNMSWGEACELEIKMITFYGRKDLGLGCLVNMTNGGQGNKGLIQSKKTKQKIRESLNGKMIGEKNPNFGKKSSEETKQKMREKATGRKSSEETKLKIKESLTGKKRSKEIIEKSIGGNNPRARKIICNITGKIYECIKDAAENNGLGYTSLISSLTGKRPNKTSLRYL